MGGWGKHPEHPSSYARGPGAGNVSPSRDLPCSQSAETGQGQALAHGCCRQGAQGPVCSALRCQVSTRGSGARIYVQLSFVGGLSSLWAARLTEAPATVDIVSFGVSGPGGERGHPQKERLGEHGVLGVKRRQNSGGTRCPRVTKNLSPLQTDSASNVQASSHASPSNMLPPCSQPFVLGIP